MLAALLPRLVDPRRAGAVTGRNLVAFRHAAYWWVVVSGVFEPMLYVLAIGFGVGALIGRIPVDGGTVPYAEFVAPAMLAASAMNGALHEATFNFFGKMKYMRLYDAVLATPVKPVEIALGELGWAMLRGGFYSVVFLALTAVLGIISPIGAALAYPAALLVSLAFGALGMGISTLISSWQDFDYVTGLQFTLFLFSGTFAPISTYPVVMQWLVQLTPLYHAVELLRGLTTLTASAALLGHAAYLAALTVVCLGVAGRRMARTLCP